MILLTAGRGPPSRSPRARSGRTRRHIHTDEPINVGHRVRVGGNTKTMTATVILQLVDEGLADLDEPVERNRQQGWSRLQRYRRCYRRWPQHPGRRECLALRQPYVGDKVNELLETAFC